MSILCVILITALNTEVRLLSTVRGGIVSAEHYQSNRALEIFFMVKKVVEILKKQVTKKATFGSWKNTS